MKRILSLIVTFIMLMVTGTTFMGCSKKVEFDEYTEYDAFRFYCYYMPPQANVGSGEYAKSYHTEEQFRYIAECGFNYAIPVLQDSVEAVVEVLEGLSRYGIKVRVGDRALYNIADLYNNGFESTDDAIKANEDLLKLNYEIYKQYDNFIGFNGADEPPYDKFEGIGKSYDFYESIDPEGEFSVNLLCYGPPTLLGVDTYKEYITEAVKQTKMTRLCFDSYPLNNDGTVKESHFANNSDIAKVASDYGLEWDCYICTYRHLSLSDPKNYDDIAWQIYVPMAYGCRGILPFTYMTPLYDESQTAMITREGERTQIYYSMQEVIKEVRAFEHMYMNSTWTGTMYHVADSDYPNQGFAMDTNAIESHSGIESIQSKADLVIGTFKDKDNRDAFLIVNASPPADDVENELTLTFNNATHVMLYKKGRKMIVELNDGKFETDMGSSEGYYLIPFSV